MPFAFLDCPSHQQLDADLTQLYRMLGGQTTHPKIAELVQEIIGSVEGKLVRPTWKSSWRLTKTVASGWFSVADKNGRENGDEAEEADSLHSALTEMVRYALDGKTLHREDKYREKLREALADYLSLRGAQTSGTKGLKEPSKEAYQAYRAHLTLGCPKQSELAEMLSNELGREIKQHTVSRWIKAVKDWLKAGNILPDLEGKPCKKPTAMDPSMIDIGARVKRDAKRQRAPRCPEND